MRQVLFRGKVDLLPSKLDEFSIPHKDTWVTGNLIQNKDETWIVGELSDVNSENILPRWWAKVIPESVGQCTGLKDKNGVVIYEGDIVTGYRGYVKSDGYKRVKYPDRIMTVGEVKFSKGEFEAFEFDVAYEHKEASELYHYRNIKNRLTPLDKGSRYYNTDTETFDLIGDGMTCKNIEIVDKAYNYFRRGKENE